MSAITLTAFGGLVPKANPLSLPSNAAQVADNCRMSAGGLEPFKAPLQVYDPTTANLKTIYRFGQTTNSDTDHWFTFSNVVDVVKGAIANDTEERTYYTGDGYPKVTTSNMALTSRPYPSTYYRLGLPAPATAPVATVSGAPTSESVIAETRFYTYTFVSSMGEESAPAPPSNEVTHKNGQTVHLMLGAVPAGAYNVTTKRIYRTTTGSKTTEYLFVAEVPAATGAYDDTVSADALGEVMPSLEYSQLPDSARGLVAMANGMMAAHTDYDVYFSVPYKPYAYPVGYMMTVSYPVVGLGAFGNSVAVLTTGFPTVMTGTDPSSISSEDLKVPYACLSKRSIASAMGGVVYAAADGLILIDGSGARVLTEGFFARREWAALKPESMLCAVWDDRVFFFYDNGTTRGGYILSSDGLTTTGVYATSAFTDPVTGSLFLCVNDKIVKWDAGLVGQFQWRSRKQGVVVPNNFSYGQVLSTAYPVTMNVYADGVISNTVTVANDQPFRLSSGFRARYWEIELLGSGFVSFVSIADTVEELQRV